MSASSLCVTCGTLSHDRCRNGPDTFLIRGSAWRLDRAELGEVLRRDLRDPRALRGRRRRRRRGLGRALEEGQQVVLGDPALRPGRGRPADRSTPSSRAIRRTLGPACAPAGACRRPAPATAGGAASGAPTASATGLRGRRAGRRLLLLHQRRRSGARAVARAQQQDRRALADLVADLDQHLGHGARRGARDVQRGLVGLQGEQRVLGVDLVAGRDVHLDDRHGAEVADVGNLDLDTVVVAVMSDVRLSSWTGSRGGFGLVGVDAVAGDGVGDGVDGTPPSAASSVNAASTTWWRSTSKCRRSAAR